MTRATPITLLTGYLGSGKTTLLARLLAHPGLSNTAVLVNELGEIALDHHLIRSVADAIVLMDRGCLCCELRSDLARQLDDLVTGRMRGKLPAFERVIIETTGLADPAPILQSLAGDPMIAALYRLDGVVTTVDAQLGDRELDQHFEAVTQVALADRLVVTKVDLVAEQAVATLEERLRALNPGAPIERAAFGAVDPALIMNAGLYDAGRKLTNARQWLRADRYRPITRATSLPDGMGNRRHDARIRSFALTFDAPVAGAALWRGLESLIESRGEALLRVKGIVNVGHDALPRVIHIVQHVLYPVTTLPAWPDDDRRTRLVFIVRDLDPQHVRDTLETALAAGS